MFLSSLTKFLLFFFFVYLLSIAVPHFFTSSHVYLALFSEDAQSIPQSVQKSTIFFKPTLQGRTVGEDAFYIFWY